MKRLLLLPALLLVLFASLTPAAIYDSGYCNWLATPEQLSALPVGTEFADLGGGLLSGNGYTGTVFDGCYLILTRNGLDLVFSGITVSPDTFPNGVPTFIQYGEYHTVYDWDTIQPPTDPLPTASNEELFQSIEIRGLYVQLSQAMQGQGLAVKSSPSVETAAVIAKPLSKSSANVKKSTASPKIKSTFKVPTKVTAKKK